MAFKFQHIFVFIFKMVFVSIFSSVCEVYNLTTCCMLTVHYVIGLAALLCQYYEEPL